MHSRTNLYSIGGGWGEVQAFLKPNIHTVHEGHWAKVRKIDFQGLGTDLPSSLQLELGFGPLSRGSAHIFIRWKRSLSLLAPGKNLFWPLLSSYPTPSLPESQILISFWEMGIKQHDGGEIGAQLVWGRVHCSDLGAAILEDQRSQCFIPDAPPASPIGYPHRICLGKVSCLELDGYF